MTSSSEDEPCYSVRLLQAFVRAVRPHEPFVEQALADLSSRDPDERIPIALAHELLEGAIHYTGDPHLGLKAGRSMALGDAGALDYVMNSASTVRDAIEIGARYMRLLNDALDVRIDADESRATISLHSQVLLSPAAEDFLVSGMFVEHIRRNVRDLTGAEVWLLRAPPDDTAEHERTFAPARVRFAAPLCGFVLDRERLLSPIVSADAKLHAVLRKHAELMLAELPQAQTFTEKVRNLLTNDLINGHTTAARMARKLHMSPRTLARRLEHEGTTFTNLLDDLRHRLGLRYMGHDRLTVAEAALLLGFSQAAAFHRAFKRWTGQTPLEYRRAQRRVGGV